MADEKNKGGRPKKELNQHDFEYLCGIFCTKEDICHFFDDIDEKTLTAWCKRTYKDADGNPLGFSEAYKRFNAAGKVSLRRTQRALAEKSSAMAIFLGKQYLGQRDYQEIALQADVNPYRNLTEEELRKLAADE